MSASFVFPLMSATVVLQSELAVAVPGSGCIGILIGLVIGGAIYGITKLTDRRMALAIFMAILTGELCFCSFQCGEPYAQSFVFVFWGSGSALPRPTL